MDLDLWLDSPSVSISIYTRYYGPMCRYPVWAGRWRSKCWVVTGGHRATAPSTAQYAALGDWGWIIWIHCTVGICAVQGLQESLVDFKNIEATLGIPYFQWTPLYVILRCTILSKPIIVTIRGEIFSGFIRTRSLWLADHTGSWRSLTQGQRETSATDVTTVVIIMTRSVNGSCLLSGPFLDQLRCEHIF